MLEHNIIFGYCRYGLICSERESSEDEVDGGSARVESYDENKNEHVEH